MRHSFQPGWGLTIASIVALTVLLSLGTWQWGKVGPKNNLIAQIEAGLGAAPVPLARLDPAADLAYRRVEVSGRFALNPALRLFGTNTSGRSGYHHYGLLETDQGAIVTSIGWTPFDQAAPFSAWPETASYSGVLLPAGSKGGFTPDNDEVQNVWHWADLEAMGAALGAVGALYPYRLILDDLAQDGVPRGGQVRVDIPNDHFEYALTWYGLALTLIGVYGFFGYRRD